MSFDMSFRRPWREVLIEQAIIAVLAIPTVLSGFWLLSCICLFIGPMTVFAVILEALYKGGYPIVLAAPAALVSIVGITAVAYGFFSLSDKYDVECASIYYALGEMVLGMFIVASYLDLAARGWL